MIKNKLKLMDFKQGTIIWLKISFLIFTLVILFFFLSKINSIFGFICAVYLALFVIPFTIILNFVGYAIFPLYLWLFLNYLFFLKNGNKRKIKSLFLIITFVVVVFWLIGLFYFFVYHP